MDFWGLVVVTEVRKESVTLSCYSILLHKCLFGFFKGLVFTDVWYFPCLEFVGLVFTEFGLYRVWFLQTDPKVVVWPTALCIEASGIVHTWTTA